MSYPLSLLAPHSLLLDMDAYEPRSCTSSDARSSSWERARPARPAWCAKTACSSRTTPRREARSGKVCGLPGIGAFVRLADGSSE